ncbi:MAG TPA: class I SAM-dependent methyltransferase [Alphaproteobacteria bacterium]|nr:class I SAM-dependent methyltransferase [Alphaproteobacteria bacterium]HOO50823.1 class I SAM-dependent methyltransferase [Alphaproteobacteria bacterium]
MGAEAFWDERYTGEAYVYGVEPNDFLKDHVGHLPRGGRVLCLSEGEGRNAVFLAEQGFDVWSVDFSSVAREKALALAVARGVALHYDVSPLSNYDFGIGQWDAIVSIFAHTDAATREDVWSKIVPSLTEGGVFFLEGYHPQQILGEYKSGGPPSVDMMVTPEMLHQSFSALVCEHDFCGERPVIEGVGHSGLAYVAQYIGRK